MNRRVLAASAFCLICSLLAVFATEYLVVKDRLSIFIGIFVGLTFSVVIAISSVVAWISGGSVIDDWKRSRKGL